MDLSYKSRQCGSRSGVLEFYCVTITLAISASGPHYPGNDGRNSLTEIP